MINKVILLGNVGKEPEVKTVNDSKVANFSIATHENYKLPDGSWKELTEWHNVEAWRGLADKIERQVQTGSLVYLEGKIRKQTWEDQSGQKRSTVRIMALDLKVLEKRKDGENSSIPNQDSHSSPKLESGQVSQAENLASDSGQDDLPF